MMNTLSLRDQRTVPGICCLLSLPCEMIMWPQLTKDSEATELLFLTARNIIEGTDRMCVYEDACLCAYMRVCLMSFILPCVLVDSSPVMAVEHNES